MWSTFFFSFLIDILSWYNDNIKILRINIMGMENKNRGQFQQVEVILATDLFNV